MQISTWTHSTIDLNALCGDFREGVVVGMVNGSPFDKYVSSSSAINSKLKNKFFINTCTRAQNMFNPCLSLELVKNHLWPQQFYNKGKKDSEKREFNDKTTFVVRWQRRRDWWCTMGFHRSVGRWWASQRNLQHEIDAIATLCSQKSRKAVPNGRYCYGFGRSWLAVITSRFKPCFSTMTKRCPVWTGRKGKIHWVIVFDDLPKERRWRAII